MCALAVDVAVLFGSVLVVACGDLYIAVSKHRAALCRGGVDVASLFTFAGTFRIPFVVFSGTYKYSNK